MEFSFKFNYKLDGNTVNKIDCMWNSYKNKYSSFGHGYER